MKDQAIIKQNSDLIWGIANLLRGPYKPPQYRRVMIPLTVLRRLDCVLEDSKKKVLAEYDKLQEKYGKNHEQIEKLINHKFKLHFHNTSAFTFATRAAGSYATLLDDPENLAANLRKYIAGFSPRARRIIEKFKFEEEIEKLDEANRLYEIIKKFADPHVDLHPDRVSNIAMGYLFEDLVRRFNEQANEEAGDHFTPREVIRLMVHLLYTNDDIYKPGVVRTIYDPTCGTGGMLSVSEEYITEQNPQAHLELFGQEYNPESYAICGSDMLIKGEDVGNIVFGDTLGTGKSKGEMVDGDGHPSMTFHYMLANPPFGVEWVPEKDYVTAEHLKLGFKGRFGAGLPRINDGALLFLQHMISKMKAAPEDGGEGSRIGIVFNGSPLFSGDAGGGESNIRRWIIENDWLEAVIGLPDQLFYNTGISTYIWILSNRKPPKRKGKVQLIDATQSFVKMKKSLGNKRNEIGDGNDGKPDHIAKITKVYADNKAVSTCKILANEEFGYLKMTVERPLRLNFAVNPERIAHFEKSGYFTGLVESKKRKDAKGRAAEVAEGQTLQKALLKALHSLSSQFTKGKVLKDRDAFEALLQKALAGVDLKLDAPLRKALLAPGVLAERDTTAEICRDAKGKPECDADLRDTENVPLPKGIKLPLPLDYESAASKGTVNKDPLIALVKKHCEAYLAKEVLPYRPDAWIDFDKTKVGYEIPFTRHFYKYEAPRPLDEIESDIKGLEQEIMAMLKEVTT